MSFLRRAFEDQTSRVFWIVNNFLAVVIIYSVASMTIESVESIGVRYERFFLVSDWIVVALFTIEYISYILIARRKREYLFSFYGIIDLLSILPTYLFLVDLRILKVLRIMRILRFLRFLRLAKMIEVTKTTYAKQKTLREVIWLNVEIYCAAMAAIIFLSSALFYIVERHAPGAKVVNMLDGMWLAMGTLVGTTYGDVFPVTAAGKVIAAGTMLLGLAMLGLMVSIVGRAMKDFLFGPELANALKDAKGKE